jgi:plastocyanin
VTKARLGITAVAAAAALGTAVVAPSLGATSAKTVSIKDDFFSPKKLTVSKGTTVKWVWKGKEGHNVAVANGPSNFRFGTRKKGSKTHTFTKRGTYSIVCTIHAPDMHMTIKVK